MFNKLLYSTLTGVFLAGLAFSAQATQQDPVINFDQSSGVAANGSLSYDGNGGPLTGDSITFDILTGRNTPQNAGTAQHLHCDTGRCQLNFTTGDNQSEGPKTWTFSDGGNFTLTGSVLDPNGDIIASGTLLSGVFSDTPTVLGSDGRLIFSSFGSDSQKQKLSGYFGIGQNATFRFSDTDIVAQGATVGDDGSFSGDVHNGDIDNTPAEVPEPGVLTTFGFALLMLGAVAALRRKNLQF